MLKIRIMVLDKTRSPFLKEGESFYLSRIKKYIQVNWTEIKPVPIKKGRSAAQILSLEGQAILRKLASNDYAVALDRSGKQYQSEKLARWLDHLSGQAVGWICFIIGGPLGLSTDIIDRADHVLSLSRMTLTHEMSRLILLEQIYRSMTILRGEKYHK
ncbi:MAG: 23S rRNA (pseudouridine(1915)-N(3))-methyltransferase RlmH [Deltaproteobacteria bacterium]|nr:23S rRNA (pseudouridine(1915)-N(3))-methyltransferase RlmH [Deltaproteobacteria bacterium]